MAGYDIGLAGRTAHEDGELVLVRQCVGYSRKPIGRPMFHGLVRTRIQNDERSIHTTQQCFGGVVLSLSDYQRHLRIDLFNPKREPTKRKVILES